MQLGCNRFCGFPGQQLHRQNRFDQSRLRVKLLVGTDCKYLAVLRKDAAATQQRPSARTRFISLRYLLFKDAAWVLSVLPINRRAYT